MFIPVWVLIVIAVLVVVIIMGHIKDKEVLQCQLVKAQHDSENSEYDLESQVENLQQEVSELESELDRLDNEYHWRRNDAFEASSDYPKDHPIWSSR